MSVRDYSRQVAKRQRISKATLIVGVDIGKAFNALDSWTRMETYWAAVPNYITAGKDLRSLVK
jgi:hypothetical protein